MTNSELLRFDITVDLNRRLFGIYGEFRWTETTSGEANTDPGPFTVLLPLDSFLFQPGALKQVASEWSVTHADQPAFAGISFRTPDEAQAYYEYLLYSLWVTPDAGTGEIRVGTGVRSDYSAASPWYQVFYSFDVEFASDGKSIVGVSAQWPEPIRDMSEAPGFWSGTTELAEPIELLPLLGTQPLPEPSAGADWIDLTLFDADFWIEGLTGDDTIQAGTGRDVLFGNAGRDVIHGGPGGDHIQGDAGRDQLIGGLGNDTLIGNDDKDFLRGGLGHDTLHGGAGSDTIFGGGHGDNAWGGGGNDWLRGNWGADALWGDGGADRLFGGTGTDTLDGGYGDDRLFGGDDNDLLVDGDGADTLWGGPGRDIFELVRDKYSDLIADFEDGIDRIRLSGPRQGFDAAAPVITDTRDGVQIALGNDLLYVVSTDGELRASDFSAADFINVWWV